MTPCRCLCRKNGFTFMEILVAMTLLSGLGIAIMSSFSSSTQMSDTQHTVGYGVGRGFIERFFEYVRADQWSTSSLPLSAVSAGPQGMTNTINGKTFTTNYTVTSVDVNTDAVEDYRRVNMTVSW